MSQNKSGLRLAASCAKAAYLLGRDGFWARDAATKY
jgi:hypothetical protein